MPQHPLAEVFGFPYNNLSKRAERYRKMKLCPYNNKVPSCTKNSVENPLGVCSVFENERPVITCPIRFRQDWAIIEDAAEFFFEPGTTWTTLSETRLTDVDGNSAGNIDFVLVALDRYGKITDFGALEVQAVYISGNVSDPFAYYMDHHHEVTDFQWTKSVRPDYLSSSRKRLAPQLIYKGGILCDWDKRMAVALQDTFYATLPSLPQTSCEEADIAWFIYHLEPGTNAEPYTLICDRIVYTEFKAALDEITTAKAGDVEDFIQTLQTKLEDSKAVYPPINPSLFDQVGT
jgi:hypothetical protein